MRGRRWRVVVLGLAALYFLAPLASSPPLEAVRRLLREQVPHLDGDRHLHPDLKKAIALVRSGAVAGAVGLPLPGLAVA